MLAQAFSLSPKTQLFTKHIHNLPLRLILSQLSE